MNEAATLVAILSEDPQRRRAIRLVDALGLPDCWIGAGFVRNAVWDHLHGRPISHLDGDVDVIWYHLGRPDAAEDRALEAALRASDPSIGWSVTNQARMHPRNGDAPYASAVDAMRCWLETATAVAVRQIETGAYDIAALFGIDDLLALTLRPTPHFKSEKHAVYLDRVRTKRWLDMWPLLRMAQG